MQIEGLDPSTIPELRRYCRKLTRNATDAEDLVQDALLRTWQARGRFDESITPGYLARAAKAAWYDRLRTKAGRAEHVPLEDWDQSVEGNSGLVELILTIAKLPKYAADALMIPILGVAYGDVPGVPENSVKSNVFRARARLSALLYGGA